MSVFLRKSLIAHINKIYRFIENTSKMTFTEKNKTFCVKNAIGIIRNLETNFIHDIIILYNKLTFKLQSYTSSIKKLTNHQYFNNFKII